LIVKRELISGRALPLRGREEKLERSEGAKVALITG
jgi:hypothetical protein